jgi:hypothetical protein
VADTALDRKRFSNPGMVSFLVICCAAAAAITLGEMFVTPLLAARLVYGFLCVLSAWLAVRSGRSGVVVQPNGVEVRGLVRTRRASWADIDGFDLTPASAINGSVYLSVCLRDGSLLSSGGLTANRKGPYAKRTLAEMEDRRSVVAPPTTIADR